MPCSIGTLSATWTEIERSRLLPNTRYCAVSSGIRICSSGFWKPPAAPFALSTPMISNGMPRMRSVWWIMAAGLAPSISGTAEPSTA